ncbi:hypothetical protein SDC49_03065 [Lactobacillus sp. R2/2]|nr:hypothetical protein [Lactobacillus sp. R2/2]
MKRFKLREIFWGIALVAAAVFLVLNQLHLLSFHLKVSMIIWTIIFGAALIESVADKSLFGTTFSIAFLLIVYAEPLHITQIVPWTVLVAALLIYLGLTLIFKRSWFPRIVYFNQKKTANGRTLAIIVQELIITYSVAVLEMLMAKI